MQRLSVRQACTKTCLPFFIFFPLVLTEGDGERREEQERESKQNEH